MRETWGASLDSDGDMCEPIFYRASYEESIYGPLKPAFSDRATESWDTVGNTGWKPSIHMPRWASRLTLEILSVRVERVQDISEDDAKAEGVKILPEYRRDSTGEAQQAFAALWDSINAKRGYGWAVNPWCWVIEFRKL